MADNLQSRVCSSNWWTSSDSGLARTLASGSCATTDINEIEGFGRSSEIPAMKSRSDEEAVDNRLTSASSGGFRAAVIQEAYKPQSTHRVLTDSSVQLSSFSLPVALVGSHGFIDDERSETSSQDMLQAENHDLNFRWPTFRQDPSMDTDRLQNNWTRTQDSQKPILKQIHQQNLFRLEDQLNLDEYLANGQSIPVDIFSGYGYPSAMLQGFVDQESQLLDLQFVNCRLNWQALSSPELSSLWPRFPQILKQASSSSSSSQTIHQPGDQPQFPNNSPASSPAQFLPPSFGEKHSTNSKRNSYEIRSSDVKNNSKETTASKIPRLATPSPLPTLKVPKEKLSDRVTALQQLVSPFGKTDTASVLQEAIQYIRFLHEQVNILSNPYMKGGVQMHQHPQNGDMTKDHEEPKVNLRSRGLCLWPISSTLPVITVIAPDWWTPSFGLNYR